MNDKQLVLRCQAGDKKAFNTLLKLHYDIIYRTAYRWCGDEPNAQDITQIACIKLARSIGKFAFESSFSSWLYRLTINCAKDFYKSPNQRNTREEQVDDLDKAAGSTQDQNAKRLYAKQILERIQHLQEDLRITLLLVYGHGLNHKDAAKKLNIKESTVSWRIHEARKHLKQTFVSVDIESPNTEQMSGGAL